MSAVWSKVRTGDAGGHRHLLTGSAVLVVGAGIQALSGFVFWLVATKVAAKPLVGNATALYTSTLFGAYLAGLGLPVALARFSADKSEQSDVIFTWGTLATVVASVVASLGYLAVLLARHNEAARVLTRFNPVLGPLLFAVMVAGAALSLIVDVRCMTVRRWNLVVARITIVGVLRIPLLFLVKNHAQQALWMFIFAAGTTALSGLLGAIWVPRIAEGRHRLGPRPATARPALRYSAVNYISTLGYQAPYFALPVIVLASVSSDQNASFYVAWGIVSVVFYVPSAIGQALLAEGGKEGAHVKSQTRLSLMVAVGLMLVGSLAAWLGSGMVESLYGHKYHEAAVILPAMMAAGIPWAISSILLTEARVHHRSAVTVVITLTLTLAIIVPALVLVPGSGAGHGLQGASKAWLLGNIGAAIITVLVTQIRRTPDEAPKPLDPILSAAG